MARQIFREKALGRLASPEQLDQLMPLTDPRGWVALGGVGLLLLLAILWSIWGRIATTVEAEGVLSRLGGVRIVAASRAAVVARVGVQTGDRVRQGQELVSLTSATVGDASQPPSAISPVAGRILAVAVSAGDVVEPGTTLLTLESLESPLKAVVYVPAGDGYQIVSGRRVQILPATQSKQQDRYWPSLVQTAGRVPATRGAMLRALGDEATVNRLLGYGPVLEIVAELAGSEVTDDIFSGTPCRAIITVEQKRPLQLIFPGFGS